VGTAQPGKLYIDDNNGDRWLSFRDNQWIVVTVDGDPSAHLTGSWPFEVRPLREATDAEIEAFNASFMPRAPESPEARAWKAREIAAESLRLGCGS
jgi:hypothetical protein